MRATRDVSLVLCALALAATPAIAQHVDARPGAIPVESGALAPVAVEAPQSPGPTKDDNARAEAAPAQRLDAETKAAIDDMLSSEPAAAEAAPADPAEPSADAATAPVAEVEAPAAEAPAPAMPATGEPDAIAAEPALTPLPAAIEQALATNGDGAAMTEFYAARDFAPLWIEGDTLGARALDARARIADADRDGLDARAFNLPAADLGDDRPETLAAAELQMSRAAIAYARQASGGRVVPSSLGGFVTAKPERPEPAAVLAAMADAGDPAATLGAYNPRHPGFLDLRRKLAEIRSEPETAASLPRVSEGPLLRPGMSDPRVAEIRARLAMPASDDVLYAEDVVAAVRDFQRGEGLKADGIVGRQTVEALNGGPTGVDAERLILANMERWRWLPHELGDTHIFVNTAEYKVRIFRGGAAIHETNVIVGTQKNQTPIFSDEMDHIVVNPSWNVPHSIASKEMLPQLIKDPTYLARQGIEVLYTGGAKPVVVSSTMIDWARVDLRKLRFRQPPGERNALGHIKFMFPNEHAVYLHDTPTRHLFARTERAFSHGCVRVEDPFALADVLLEDSDWDAQKLKSRIGGREQRINLVHKIPIHIAYFTAQIAADGELVTFPDIYGHDAKTEQALDLGARVEAALSAR